MPARRKAPSVNAARLAVLAASDERAFVAHAAELLSSGSRTAREAALEALLERPDAALREPLRALFFELAADGAKRDQGGELRARIVRILRNTGDVRDADVGLIAASTRELIFGDDSTWQLRAHGLGLLAATSPDVFPFLAVEQLDDGAHDGEPARTAFQLLAAAGQLVPIYQWLLRADPSDPMLPGAFELLLDAPPGVVERYASRALTRAVNAGNEALTMSLCETVVRAEFSGCYAAIGAAMFMKMSGELYSYLAVLLAGTNRGALLAVLEEQLHRGRHPRIIADALRVRPTTESQAILRRWEDGE